MRLRNATSYKGGRLYQQVKQSINQSIKNRTMRTLENIGDTFLKQSIISTIIMLAEKIRGRESVSNLIQYRYKELMEHSYEELEAIRDGHLKAYNQLINQ